MCINCMRSQISLACSTYWVPFSSHVLDSRFVPRLPAARDAPYTPNGLCARKTVLIASRLALGRLLRMGRCARRLLLLGDYRVLDNHLFLGAGDQRAHARRRRILHDLALPGARIWRLIRIALLADLLPQRHIQHRRLHRDVRDHLPGRTSCADGLPQRR